MQSRTSGSEFSIQDLRERTASGHNMHFLLPSSQALFVPREVKTTTVAKLENLITRARMIMEDRFLLEMLPDHQYRGTSESCDRDRRVAS